MLAFNPGLLLLKPSSNLITRTRLKLRVYRSTAKRRLHSPRALPPILFQLQQNDDDDNFQKQLAQNEASLPKERTRLVKLLSYNLVNGKESSTSIRLGYILATLSAGATGGVSLFLTSAVGLLLATAVQAPPVLASSLSLLVAALIDIGRSSYNPIFGSDSPNIIAIPFLLFALLNVATAYSDPNFSLQPPASTPDEAVERIRQKMNETRLQTEADERAIIRRKLGIDRVDSIGDDDEESQNKLYQWDRTYLDEEQRRNRDE